MLYTDTHTLSLSHATLQDLAALRSNSTPLGSRAEAALLVRLGEKESLDAVARCVRGRVAWVCVCVRAWVTGVCVCVRVPGGRGGGGGLRRMGEGPVLACWVAVVVVVAVALIGSVMRKRTSPTTCF